MNVTSLDHLTAFHARILVRMLLADIIHQRARAEKWRAIGSSERATDHDMNAALVSGWLSGMGVDVDALLAERAREV